MVLLDSWKKKRQTLLTCLFGVVVGTFKVFLANASSPEECFIMNSFFFETQQELLLQLPEQHLHPFDLSLEPFTTSRQIDRIFSKLERYSIQMICKIRMIGVAILSYPVQLFLKPTCHQIYVFSIFPRGFQVFPDLADFLSVLIKQGLCVRENFGDFVVHMAHLCDVFIIVVFYDFRYIFLLLHNIFFQFVDIGIGLLHQFLVQPEINSE